MTEQDIDVWEALAVRLLDKYGNETAGKIITGLMLKQSFKPEYTDALIMTTLSDPQASPILKRLLREAHAENMDS